MKTKLIAILATMAVIMTGCADMYQPQSYVPPAERSERPTHSRQDLSDGQAKALRLKLDMTQAEVTELLGQPDETSSQTYGSSTPHPWQGIEWVYRWWRGDFFAKRLNIVFAEGSGTWMVNNWNWSDFN